LFESKNFLSFYVNRSINLFKYNTAQFIIVFLHITVIDIRLPELLKFLSFDGFFSLSTGHEFSCDKNRNLLLKHFTTALHCHVNPNLKGKISTEEANGLRLS
jgi:hypothetical protein